MRQSLFVIDLVIYAWFTLLLILTISGALFGSGEHTGSLLLHLLPMLAAYYLLTRVALCWHRNQRAAKPSPKWLVGVAVIGVLSPLFVVPATFLKIGEVMEDNGLIRPIESHPDFDQSANYDPDHAAEAGLKIGPYGAATADDLRLKALDEAIFGVYPPQWARQFHAPWLSGVMQLGYLFYYLAPVLAVVPLLFQRRWREFRLGTAVIGGCIIATYVAYLAVPATGPRFEGGIKAWLPAESGWFGAETIYRAIDSAETFRWNAFPSGHVAVSIACLLIALRFNRRIGLAMILPVLALCLATIYMGYHYGTDVIGGMLFAAGSIWLFPRLAKWWEKPLWESADVSP